jgi:threonine/homoserine efflux transporter RhtA
MLILILVIVIALVAWALHLMQQAVDRSEFSLMLAGTLVAFSAAAMIVVYFLMGNYIGYVTGMAHPSIAHVSSSDEAAWVIEFDSLGSNTKAPTFHLSQKPTESVSDVASLRSPFY